MFDLETAHGIVKVYAETIEKEAVSQIVNMANSPIGENADIRIMPDAHAGAGCTIGTTMKITDKVCPNLVGVDIGCGVDLIKTTGNFEHRLDELDKIIREFVPFGMSVHGNQVVKDNYFKDLLCWNELSDATKVCALRSLGTLGGGNHFIEAYEDGHISVHSGSRNIGYKVAEYYQTKAVQKCGERVKQDFHEAIMGIEPEKRQAFIQKYKTSGRHFDKELCWLEGDDMKAYLHDIKVMQKFAYCNRIQILATIAKHMNINIAEVVATSVHNYIDTENMILRKGAISAGRGERVAIPMNMRDGILVGVGKGNAEWNYSAPHGAGRLYSRSKAKEIFTVDEYEESMKGIYTTCVSHSTLDEAPFVYKDYHEIRDAIEPTVDVMYRLKPIYNFKA